MTMDNMMLAQLHPSRKPDRRGTDRPDRPVGGAQVPAAVLGTQPDHHRHQRANILRNRAETDQLGEPPNPKRSRKRAGGKELRLSVHQQLLRALLSGSTISYEFVQTSHSSFGADSWHIVGISDIAYLREIKDPMSGNWPPTAPFACMGGE